MARRSRTRSGSAARHSAASPGIAFPVKRGSGAHVVYGLAASRQEVANGSCVLAYLTGLAEAVRSLRSRENSKCSPGPGEGRENRVFLTAKIPASVAGHAFALTSCMYAALEAAFFTSVFVTGKPSATSTECTCAAL